MVKFDASLKQLIQLSRTAAFGFRNQIPHAHDTRYSYKLNVSAIVHRRVTQSHGDPYLLQNRATQT